jgi:hypothetical protein
MAIPSMHASAALSTACSQIVDEVNRWARRSTSLEDLVSDIEDEHGELGREIARVIVAVRKASVEREQG